MKEKKTGLGYSNKLDYIREYSEEKYERINLSVPKGMKQHYKSEADKRGLTISKLFTIAADDYIENH